MKHSIRNTKPPMQPNLGAQAEELYETYSKKSEAELLDALKGMRPEERAQLSALQRELAPMLSKAQQEKLAAIVRSLTT